LALLPPVLPGMRALSEARSLPLTLSETRALPAVLGTPGLPAMRALPAALPLTETRALPEGNLANAGVASAR